TPGDRRGRRDRANGAQAAPGRGQPGEPEGDLRGRSGDRSSHAGEAPMRIGQGFDVHPFAEGRKLVIGGVEIAYHKGLLGHSDADVLLHAICDALLGAAGLGDIGRHYPDDDASYAGIDSRTLLRDVAKKLRGLKLQVVNLDATLIAQEPRLAPHMPPMIANLAADLGLPPAAGKHKATTHEEPGLNRRREGNAAPAV